MNTHPNIKKYAINGFKIIYILHYFVIWLILLKSAIMNKDGSLFVKYILVLLKFLNDNMQIHLVKNVKLRVIANILKLNF